MCPDLYSHIKPTLLGLLPQRWRHAVGADLVGPRRRGGLGARRRAAAAAVVGDDGGGAAPRHRHGVGERRHPVARADRRPGPTARGRPSVVRVLSILAIALPVLAMVYLLVRVVRRTVRLGARARPRAVRSGGPSPSSPRWRCSPAWRTPGGPATSTTARSGPPSAARCFDAVPAALAHRVPVLRRAAPRAAGRDVAARGPAGHCADAVGQRREAAAEGRAAARAGAGAGRCRAARRRGRHRRPGGGSRGADLGLPVRPAGRARRGRQPGARRQHHRRLRPLRRGVRSRVGRRRATSTEHQRGLRVRQLHAAAPRSRSASRSCWSSARPTSSCRRTSRRRSTTTASQCVDLRARAAAGHHPRRPAQRRRDRGDRGGLGSRS